MKSAEIQLSIESKLENVPLRGGAVNRLCRLIQFNEADAHAIELCVTEAVVNSIKHGYASEPGYRVDVIFRQETDQLVITVSDSGRPMDPALLDQKKRLAIHFDPKDIQRVPDSGRGLAIMQGYMDAVRYREEGRIKHFELIKKIL
jgi:anti-sigma regulatory factor (Ser/Thr protein kinase)